MIFLLVSICSRDTADRDDVAGSLLPHPANESTKAPERINAESFLIFIKDSPYAFIIQNFSVAIVQLWRRVVCIDSIVCTVVAKVYNQLSMCSLYYHLCKSNILTL